MNEKLQDLIQRVEVLTHQVRQIRVERWLAEWPLGHSERPVAPKFVREFVKGE